jgi:hypothetical protein
MGLSSGDAFSVITKKAADKLLLFPKRFPYCIHHPSIVCGGLGFSMWRGWLGNRIGAKLFDLILLETTLSAKFGRVHVICNLEM